MSGGPYPVGNIIECPFAFTTRPLTTAEQAVFEAGGGLPTSTGVDQANVFFDLKINNGAVDTMTGGSIVRDATGAYHVLVTAAEPGRYEYRGYSKDDSGNPLGASAAHFFDVIPFP